MKFYQVEFKLNSDKWVVVDQEFPTEQDADDYIKANIHWMQMARKSLMDKTILKHYTEKDFEKPVEVKN